MTLSRSKEVKDTVRDEFSFRHGEPEEAVGDICDWIPQNRKLRVRLGWSCQCGSQQHGRGGFPDKGSLQRSGVQNTKTRAPNSSLENCP